MSERSATRASTDGVTSPVPDEVYQSHRDLSRASERLLDLAQQRPDVAMRVDYRASPGLPDYVQAYPFRLQTWPVLVGGRKLEDLRRATVEVIRLIKEIPRRILGDDPRRVAEVFDLPDPLLARVLLEPPQGLQEALARVDLVDTGEAWKVLEVNFGGNIGGWQHRYWQDACRANPWLQEVLQGAEARYRDPLPILFEHVVSHTRSTLGVETEVNTFLGFDPEDLPVVRAEAGRLRRLYSDVVAAAGTSGDLIVGNIEELRVRPGPRVLTRDGRVLQALVDCGNRGVPREVVRCWKAGSLQVFNGPLAELLGSKKTLALLSMWADRGEIDPRDRYLVQEHVPWSRVVEPGRTAWRGSEAELREILVEAQDDLVLKPLRGSQGDGVAVGRFTTAEEWYGRVRRAYEEGSWLVQEYFPSRPYLFQHGERGTAIHDLVWGTFSFGAGYGGGFVRMVPRGKNRSGVVNSARGAEEGILLEVAD